MILLDTHAIIWIDQRHRRTRPLVQGPHRLCVSPASALELQVLVEAGRIRLKGATVSELMHRDVWTLDDPPAAAWFDAALGIGWTRDPFDRLLVAHAALRGWRLATADAALLEELPERSRFVL